MGWCCQNFHLTILSKQQIYLRAIACVVVVVCLFLCGFSRGFSHPQICCFWSVAGANPDPAEEQQAQSESHGTQDALLR